MTTLSSIFGTDVEEIEPMAIPEPLGDYGLDTNPSPYGTLQLKEYPFYALGDAPEPGLGEAARTAGGRVGFNIRQNPQNPFDMYPEGVNYMDSGLDDLNLMFPTAADMPYDPFDIRNVAQQLKNMDPNAFDPNWKNKIHNPKGGPLAGPDAYDTGYVATGDYDYDTGYVGAGDYSGMSYGL